MERFLREKYWLNPKFREAVEKRARRKEAISKKHEEQIPYFLEELKDVLKDERGKEHFLNLILYPNYLIKPENISDDYIKNVDLSNFAESKGYQREDLRNPTIRQSIIELFEKETGQNFEKYQIPQDKRLEIVNNIIENQKLSLKLWLDYLTSLEAENYPPAFRYWIFAEILKLGVYQPDKKDFTKRTEKTVAPFPELNPQALSMVLDLIIKKYSGEQLDLAYLNEEKRKEFEKNLQSENFGKLYGWCLDYVKSLKTPKEKLVITIGEWRIFEKGSDPRELTKSVQGYNTGWCIINEIITASYLRKNHIFIYFSQDENGINSIPRAAIVYNPMESTIVQVRGIDEGQNLDPYIASIVEKKLNELPNGKEWIEISKDVKKVTQIYLKTLNNERLTREELRFIFQIDRPIRSFSFFEDLRLDEIISRIPIEDINEILKDIDVFNGNLYLSGLKSAKGLKLPKKIIGSLYLSGLVSAEGLELPEKIYGNLDLSSLTFVEELNLPEEIKGDLILSSLKSAKGLKFPKRVGGNIFLLNLTSIEGLELPKDIGGNIYFSEKLSPVEIEELKIKYPHLKDKIRNNN